MNLLFLIFFIIIVSFSLFCMLSSDECEYLTTITTPVRCSHQTRSPVFLYSSTWAPELRSKPLNDTSLQRNCILSHSAAGYRCCLTFLILLSLIVNHYIVIWLAPYLKLWNLLWQFGFNMFPHEIPRNFSTEYKCYSASMMPGQERQDVEQGGKSNVNCIFFWGGGDCTL